MTTDQIQTICFDCATALGYTLKDKAIGVWVDKCEVCKQPKPCTDLHHDWVPPKQRKRIGTGGRNECKNTELGPNL